MFSNKIIRILLGVVTIVVLFVLTLYLNRLFGTTQVDDVTPGIECDSSLLEKSDILWVIPIFNNYSIAENKEWCDYILSLNKTIGLHGVYHEYDEFSVLRDENYLQAGINAFEKCFGYKPQLFKAPQLALSGQNKILLEKEGFTVYEEYNQIANKVYHCSDTGRFSNRFIDRF